MLRDGNGPFASNSGAGPEIYDVIRCRYSLGLVP